MSSTQPEELLEGLIQGDRRALARCITMAESTRPDHRYIAEQIIEGALPHTGRALRLGITGTPGVGKSTFINVFGKLITGDGHRLAVLAIDPSSAAVSGAILGDKTRMGELAANPKVFIRPSPSGGISGGVASRTRDAILLCEAAGYDIVFVETVGVGQSEIAVSQMTDLLLLLLAPVGGDDLQGIKRGVLELADVIAVNKADGELINLAEQTANEYRHALHLVRPKRAESPTEIVTCSALTGNGMAELWAKLLSLHQHVAQSGELTTLRGRQAVAQLDAEIQALLFAQANANDAFNRHRAELQDALRNGSTSVSAAARSLAALLIADRE